MLHSLWLSIEKVFQAVNIDIAVGTLSRTHY